MCYFDAISAGVLNFVVVQVGDSDRLPDFDGSVLTGERGGRPRK